MQPVTTTRKAAHNAVDMTGRVLGRLTVRLRAETARGKAMWLCECECGAQAVVSGDQLRQGRTRSCGCLVRDRRPVMERFFEKVDRSGDCWIWNGSRDGKGYGSFYLEGRLHKAHRAAWMLLKGPIPDGIEACHRCDTPPCCNPDHIFLGTHAENMADARTKGRITWPDDLSGTRHNGGKGYCPKGHPYVGDNLIVRRDTGHRECRACKREKNRNYAARMRQARAEASA